MITSAFRATVSVVTLATALSATITLGACSHAATPNTWNGAVATPDGRVTIDFVNEAQAPVDVYLIGDVREWRLGRVAPGAHTTLAIPARELSATTGFVRLAVLSDAPFSQQAAREPRATTTMAQPVVALLGQRWTFRPRQLMSAEIFGERVNAARVGGRP